MPCSTRYPTAPSRPRLPWTTLAVFCLCLALTGPQAPAVAQTATAAANEPPLSIAVFTSSRKDQCYDNGIVAAIEQLTKAEQKRINAEGGILRRRLGARSSSTTSRTTRAPSPT